MTGRTVGQEDRIGGQDRRTGQEDRTGGQDRRTGQEDRTGGQDGTTMTGRTVGQEDRTGQDKTRGQDRMTGQRGQDSDDGRLFMIQKGGYSSGRHPPTLPSGGWTSHEDGGVTGTGRRGT